MKDITLSILLVLVAVLFRTVWHLGPNFEVVTSATLAAGYYIGNRKLRFVVPVAIMLISDSIIGNGLIFLFTWSAYIFTPLIATLLKRVTTKSLLVKFLLTESAALLALLVFFLWTNAGVVVVSNMYPKSIEGLISSYINGLPFIKPQLISALIATPIIFGLSAVLTNKLNKLEANFKRKNTQYISVAV